MICPLLITNSDKVLGVLHLYNTKAQITVNELIRIKYVCDIIASCIDNANQFTIVFGTMVELNEAIKKINSIGYEEISKDEIVEWQRTKPNLKSDFMTDEPVI